MPPRAAKLLLPYRAIRLLEARLHEALLRGDASSRELERRGQEIAALAAERDELDRRDAGLAQELDKRGQEIAALAAERAELDRHAAGLAQELEKRAQEVTALAAERDDLDRRAAGLTEEVAKRGQEISTLIAERAEHERAQSDLKGQVAQLTEQVHVLSNEKFALQQDRLIGGRSIHDLAGLLGWPQILDESARMNGFAELLRVVGLFAASPHAVDGASECWAALGTKNYDQILTDGYANFKRTIGTNYFNFLVQGGDPQIAAAEELVSAQARAQAMARAVEAPDDPALALPDQSIYRYFVLLLWEYAISIDRKGVLSKLREPAEGNPIVVKVGDVEASQDLANSVIEYYAFESHLRTDRPTNVVEIGGGYGRNAYVILSLHENARMTLVDIPPALFVAQRYLSSVLPDRRVFRVRDFARYEEVRKEMEGCSVVFLMPHQLALLPKRHFDLGLNISSFGEMSAEQLAWYFGALSRVIGGHFYMKQWEHSKNVFDGIDLKEQDYPIPAHWAKVTSRPCLVQREFFEAVYRAGAAA